MAKRCGVNKPCHRGIKGGLFSPFFNNGVDLSGYGLGPGPSSGGGIPYSSEYQAVLNQSGTSKSATPTTSQKIAQDLFLTTLKTAGILSVTDVLKVKATNGSPNFTDINWVNPSANTSIRIKAPKFTRNDGFKTNGSDNYTDENWAPSAGVNYTLNSGEFIVYYKDIVQGILIDGCRDAGTANQTLITPLNGATQINGVINSSASGLVTDAQFDATDGMYFVGRTSSSSGFVRKGSNTRVTYSTTSSGRSTRAFKNGCLDTNGTLGQFHTRKNLLFWSGGVLTTQQEDAFKAAWDTYYATISAESALPTLGTLYNQSTWADVTTGFINNGSTVSLSSGKLQFTGGTGVFSKTLDLNRYTCLEKWKWTCQVKADTKAAGASGFGFGVRSVSTHDQYDMAGWFSSSSTIASGQTFIYTGANGTYTSRANTTAVTFSAADIIEITVERDGDTFNVSARNVTTASATVTATYTVASTSPILPNTSRFAIFSIGGTFTVQSLLLESGEQKNAPYLVVGDSKSEYYFASKYGLRYASLLGDYLKPGVVLAGSSDKTAEYLLRVQEIIDLNPSVVIIGGASNDPRFGVSSATTNANYSALISAIQAGLPNANIVNTTGFYETSGVDQTPLQAYIIANYPNNYVDTLPVTLVLNGDVVHPADAGHATITTTIINSGKIAIA